MLDAAFHKKLRAALSEDEITSSIFGPMRYFDSRKVFLFFYHLIDSSKIYNSKRKAENDEIIPPGPKPTIPVENIKCEMHFWPRLSNDKEPDLIIDFFRGEVLIWTFLIEIKWNAQVSEDQLYYQRNGLLKDRKYNKNKLTHLLIVLNKKQALLDIKSYHFPVAVVDWSEFCSILSTKHIFDKNYNKSSISFINKLGVLVFNGFNDYERVSESDWKPYFVSKFNFEQIGNRVEIFNLKWSLNI